MSFAWRILQAVAGNEVIEDAILNEHAIDLKSIYPKSLISEWKLPFESSAPCQKLSNASIPHDNALAEIDPPIYYEKEIMEMPDASEEPHQTPPLKEISLEARKKYRRILLRGKENDISFRKNKKKKRQSKIYREIFFQKMSRKFAIPREDFESVVDEIMDEQFPDYAIDGDALVALQRESEMMLTKMMCLAGYLCNHGSRETLLVKDFKLLKLLFSKNKEGCSFEM